jgi:formylglycine-generating enzyme required for sulfatase activity
MRNAVSARLFPGLMALLPCMVPSGAAVAQSVIRDSIAGTLVTFEMVLVPGSPVPIRKDTPGAVNVRPFYIGRTEVTWDMYDVFLLRLDTARSKSAADALARPSQPYAVPDYDWGHAGYAAISVSHHAAKAFAEWLSVKTGHRYRLPTETEWVHAATVAAGNRPTLPREYVDEVAWHRDNSDRQTHPVASKRADHLGLFDLFGNAAEWVVPDQPLPMPVTRGGSFRDDPATLGPRSRAVQDARWTERDPQLPTSRWWLTDGPFVGFRIVRDP